jgi:mRNA interferase MazF
MSRIGGPNEVQEYDRWNELKKRIQLTICQPTYFPNDGEVWMSSLGKNIGHEQNGGGSGYSRPVLIVRKFNNHMFWCVPLSTTQKRLDFYFNFTDTNGRQVSAILAQLKLQSVKRFERKMYKIPSNLFMEIKVRLRAFLE